MSNLNKKKLFKIALIIADMSYDSFGQEYQVSKQAVSQVLSGRDTSQKINDAIDKFIEANIKELQHKLPKIHRII